MKKVVSLTAKKVEHDLEIAAEAGFDRRASHVFSRSATQAVNAADIDNDGVISAEELKAYHNKAKAQHESEVGRLSRRVKRSAALGVLVTVALVLSVLFNAIAMSFLIDRAATTTVSEGTPVLEAKGSGGSVAQVAKARQTIPLGLATLLDHEGLMSIDKVTVRKLSYDESESAPDAEDQTPMVEYSSYTVMGYDWQSKHEMVFELHDGSIIQVRDGSSWLFDLDDGIPYQICSTEMESAMFKTSGIDVDALIASSPNATRRRALAQSNGGCSDMAQLEADVDEMLLTSPEAREFISQMQAGEADVNASVAANFTFADADADGEAEEDSDGGDGGSAGGRRNRRQLLVYNRVRRAFTGANGKRSKLQKAQLTAMHALMGQFTGIEDAEFDMPEMEPSSECRPLYDELNEMLDSLEALVNAQDALNGVFYEVGNCLWYAGVPTATALKLIKTVASLMRTLATSMSSMPYIGGVMSVLKNAFNSLANLMTNVISRHANFKKNYLEPAKDTILDLELFNALLAKGFHTVYTLINDEVIQPLLISDTACPDVPRNGICASGNVNDLVDHIRDINNNIPAAAPFNTAKSGLLTAKAAMNPVCSWVENSVISAFTSFFDPGSSFVQVLQRLERFISKKHCFKVFWKKFCFRLNKVPKVVKKTLGRAVDAFLRAIGVERLIKKAVNNIIKPLGIDSLYNSLAGSVTVPSLLGGFSLTDALGMNCLSTNLLTADSDTLPTMGQCFSSASPMSNFGSDKLDCETE